MANLTSASDMWQTWAWSKYFNLTREIKALILNKYIRVNVRHRALKYWLAQTSGFVLLATVATLNLTTQKNHPVYNVGYVFLPYLSLRLKGGQIKNIAYI